jgi:hypothetical protein
VARAAHGTAFTASAAGAKTFALFSLAHQIYNYQRNDRGKDRTNYYCADIGGDPIQDNVHKYLLFWRFFFILF